MKGHVTLRLRSFPISFHVAKRTMLVIFLLLLLTSGVAVTSLGMGEMAISPVDVLRALWGSGSDQHVLVVQTFRLPRILVGLLVGAALGAAGAIMQGLIRNPLASPDILGVTGGASVAAVAFIIYLQALSIWWLPAFAFTGAMLVTLFLYGLAWKQGVTPFRLVLVGIGVKAAAAALTTMLVVTSPIYLTQRAMIWLTGSIYGSSWNDVMLIAPWVLVLLGMAFAGVRQMNLLQLGDDVAVGAGLSVQMQRLFLLFLCAALTGSAVAVGGTIGFVALLAPHIARQLVGRSFGGVLPVSAITGSLIVLVADLAGRILFSPLDIPVGVFTSAVGAPFFLYLLYRSRNR
jgi:iron complex transport system permease protein